MKVLPGQLDLFRVDNYLNNVVSSFANSGITQISTRTKACVKHPPISRETIDRIARHLSDLPSLKHPKH